MSGGEQRARVKREETEKTVKRSSIPQQKETRVIYIPGQPVNNISTNNDYKVILATMREVLFNFKSKSFKNLTVEVEKFSSSSDVRHYGVFDFQNKKQIVGKFSLKNGEPYRVQISRFFKGVFVVKSNGKVIGRYKPSLMDLNRYGMIEKLWIEPIYIGFTEIEKTPVYLQKEKDDYVKNFFKTHSDGSFSFLNQTQQFNKLNQYLPAPYRVGDVKNTVDDLGSIEPKEQVVMITYNAAVKKFVKSQEVMVENIEGVISEENFYELVKIIAQYGTPEDAAVLSGISYTKENAHWRKVLKRKVQIKWVKNNMVIVFKGYSPPLGFTYAGFGHKNLKSLTGGITINKKPKRIWMSAKEVNSFKNIGKSISKGLGALSLAIDIFGDIDTVMVDEKGSKDVNELMGRIGISVIFAAAGVAFTTLALSAVLSALALGPAAPIGIVLIAGIITVAAIGYGMSLASTGTKNLLFKQ